MSTTATTTATSADTDVAAAAFEFEVYEITKSADKVALAEALQYDEGFAEVSPQAIRQLSLLFRESEFHVLIATKKNHKKKKALRASEILGFVMFRMTEIPKQSPNKANMNAAVGVIDLFVHRDYRRHGVAKRLVAALEQEARNRALAGDESSWFTSVMAIVDRENLLFWLQGVGYGLLSGGNGAWLEGEVNEKTYLLCDKAKAGLFCEEIKKLAPVADPNYDCELFKVAQQCGVGVLLSNDRGPVMLVCNGGEMDATKRRFR